MGRYMEGVKNIFGSWFSATESERGEGEEAQKEENCAENETETAMEALENIDEMTESSEVCKFYLENKCRFGDKCRNRHEGEQVKKLVKNEQSRKKNNEESDT